MIDYQTVTANPDVGVRIGRLYLDASPEITPAARDAYRQFAEQVEEQYAEMARHIRVIFQEADPYPSAAHMMRDVRENATLRVYATTPDQAHPVLTNDQNNHFRAVHDYYGHCQADRGFDRHGEEAAWMAHSQMFTGMARRAMTSETRGQNSAFIWILGGGDNFPPQKAVLLPAWCSELP